MNIKYNIKANYSAAISFTYNYITTNNIYIYIYIYIYMHIFFTVDNTTTAELWKRRIMVALLKQSVYRIMKVSF